MVSNLKYFGGTGHTCINTAYWSGRGLINRLEALGERRGELKECSFQTHFSSASTASETCSEPTGSGSNVFPFTCPAMTKTLLLSW